jgi:hypothetical protein
MLAMKKQVVIIGPTTRQQPATCLECGAVFDAATGVGNADTPKPGAIAICTKCGHIQAFNAQLQFRPLTAAEAAAMAKHEIVQGLSAEYRKKRLN